MKLIGYLAALAGAYAAHVSDEYETYLTSSAQYAAAIVTGGVPAATAVTSLSTAWTQVDAAVTAMDSLSGTDRTTCWAAIDAQLAFDLPQDASIEDYVKDSNFLHIFDYTTTESYVFFMEGIEACIGAVWADASEATTKATYEAAFVAMRTTVHDNMFLTQIGFDFQPLNAFYVGTSGRHTDKVTVYNSLSTEMKMSYYTGARMDMFLVIESTAYAPLTSLPTSAFVSTMTEAEQLAALKAVTVISTQIAALTTVAEVSEWIRLEKVKYALLLDSDYEIIYANGDAIVLAYGYPASTNTIMVAGGEAEFEWLVQGRVSSVQDELSYNGSGQFICSLTMLVMGLFVRYL